MPITGAHRRSPCRAFRTMPAMTISVVSALSGAASGDVPSGTFSNCSRMTGMTVTGMTVTGVSIMTVPVTVGVRIRLNSESRTEKTNWKIARPTTRIASRAGPPAASAAMLTAIATPEVPVARM